MRRTRSGSFPVNSLTMLSARRRPSSDSMQAMNRLPARSARLCGMRFATLDHQQIGRGLQTVVFPSSARMVLTKVLLPFAPVPCMKNRTWSRTTPVRDIPTRGIRSRGSRRPALREPGTRAIGGSRQPGRRPRRTTWSKGLRAGGRAVAMIVNRGCRCRNSGTTDRRQAHGGKTGMPGSDPPAGSWRRFRAQDSLALRNARIGLRVSSSPLWISSANSDHSL